MAIGGHLAAKVVQLCRDSGPSGGFARLRRPRWTGRGKGRAGQALQNQFAASAIELPPPYPAPETSGTGLYAEQLSVGVGFDRFDSIDIPEVQGATPTQGLSVRLDPPPAARFGVIHDGGSSEHICHVADLDLDRRLRAGTAPDFGFGKSAAGYEVLACMLIPVSPQIGHALKRVFNTPLRLEYVERKPRDGAGPTGRAQQTDYQQRWREQRPGGQ